MVWHTQAKDCADYVAEQPEKQKRHSWPAAAGELELMRMAVSVATRTSDTFRFNGDHAAIFEARQSYHTFYTRIT